MGASSVGSVKERVPQRVAAKDAGNYRGCGDVCRNGSHSERETHPYRLDTEAPLLAAGRRRRVGTDNLPFTVPHINELAVSGPSAAQLRGRVVVTGAGGFIGRHVCDVLRSNSWAVCALTRRPMDLGISEAAVVPDWNDTRALSRVMCGADAVVHLAGLAHVLDGNATWDEYNTANVLLADRITQAAVTSGVRRFVLMSSAAVTVRSTIADKANDPYAATKRMAEDVVRRAADEGGMTAWILRPPLVYGPGMKGNPLRLFHMVHSRVPLPLGAIENQRSFLYVGNLADAVCAALASSDQRGGTFDVTDWPAMSTPAFIRAVATAAGLPTALIPVPVSVLGLLARGGEAFRRIGLAVPGVADVERLVSSYAVDGSEIRQRTGYKPTVLLETALRVTDAWYRESVRDHIRL